MSDFPTVSIPSSWIWCRIQDVATTATGGTPSRSISEYFGGSIPWVKSGELGDCHVFETEETLSELGLKSSNAKLFPKGTLCIALYGATVGKLGILEVDAATNQAVCGIFLPDEVHRDFAFYYLASIRRHLIEQGKGGAQSNISNGLVRETSIPIAPLNEQQRIVAKIEELFSDLDAGVAALKRAKANLKRYRASVLKAAVEGKLTEQWRSKHPAKEPASALLARILKERRLKWEADQLAKFAAAKKEPPKNWRDKYVEPTPPDTTGLSKLPDGWCWASVDQVAQFTRYGSSAKTNEEVTGVPVIRMGNIIDGTLDYSELKFLPHGHPEFPDLLLKKGDLLFNRTNSAELVGKSAVYDGQYDPCSFASYLISVRCLAGCDPAFLCFYINSTYGRRWVKSVVSQQVGQANVNGSKLQSLAFPLPSVAVQIEIVTEVAEKLYQIEATANTIDHDLFLLGLLFLFLLICVFSNRSIAY